MMMPDEIVVSVLPGDARCAWLRNGELIRLTFDDGSSRPRMGDVFLGRVTHVDRALGAAFVDIGSDQAGFLMLGDHVPVHARDTIGNGQAVIVQVVRAPEVAKGAKLTGRLMLCGDFLSFIPFGDGITLASEAGDSDASKAMLERARGVLPQQRGWIIHPRGVDADIDALKSDSQKLLTRWNALQTTAAAAMRAPVCLDAAVDEVTAFVREGISSRLSCIHVDDSATLMRLRASFPSVAELIEIYRGPVPAFAAFEIDAQLEEAFAPAVSLPSGGQIMIAETEALVAVDVNTGATRGAGDQSTAMAANLEAAAVLARLIQLRDLAGHIVIDFVPLRRKPLRAKVMAALREALSGDDRQVDIPGYTQLGLVHLTRERSGQTLRQRLTVSCSHCAGEGRVISPVIAAGDALRRLMAEALRTPGQKVALEASADVVEALDVHFKAALAACASRLGYVIDVRHDPGLPPHRYSLSSD